MVVAVNNIVAFRSFVSFYFIHLCRGRQFVNNYRNNYRDQKRPVPNDSDLLKIGNLERKADHRRRYRRIDTNQHGWGRHRTTWESLGGHSTLADSCTILVDRKKRDCFWTALKTLSVWKKHIPRGAGSSVFTNNYYCSSG